MATHGETFNVDFPRVQITGNGAGSESIDINPADSTTFRYIGNRSFSRMVTYKPQSATNSGGVVVPEVPVIKGTVTVTITTDRGTSAIYTINGKNPTYKAIDFDANNATQKKIQDRARSKATLYKGAFTLELTPSSAGRPSTRSNPVVLRIRSHKVVNGVISPNEKSPVVVVKFLTVPA